MIQTIWTNNGRPIQQLSDKTVFVWELLSFRALYSRINIVAHNSENILKVNATAMMHQRRYEWVKDLWCSNTVQLPSTQM